MLVDRVGVASLGLRLACCGRRGTGDEVIDGPALARKWPHGLVQQVARASRKKRKKENRPLVDLAHGRAQGCF